MRTTVMLLVITMAAAPCAAQTPALPAVPTAGSPAAELIAQQKALLAQYEEDSRQTRQDTNDMRERSKALLDETNAYTATTKLDIRGLDEVKAAAKASQAYVKAHPPH